MWGFSDVFFQVGLTKLMHFQQGIVCAPKPFLCDIRPRSEGHAEIIRSDFQEARPTFRQFEQELSNEGEESG